MCLQRVPLREGCKPVQLCTWELPTDHRPDHRTNVNTNHRTIVCTDRTPDDVTNRSPNFCTDSVANDGVADHTHIYPDHRTIVCTDRTPDDFSHVNTDRNPDDCSHVNTNDYPDRCTDHYTDHYPANYIREHGLWWWGLRIVTLRHRNCRGHHRLRVVLHHRVLSG
jgi:hypothetical protein